MTPTLLINLVIWYAIWIAGWRAFYGPLRRKRINYVDRFGTASAYFALLTAAGALAFRDTLSRLAFPDDPTPFVALGAVFACQTLIYAGARKVLERPSRLIAENPLELFLRLDYRYLLSKSFEVLYQQVMIAVLVLTAGSIAGSLARVMLIFGVLFALGHVPMLGLFGAQSKHFARLYIGAAVASALVFPPLILEIRGGIVYSYIVHTLFYTLLGMVFWIRHTVEARARHSA